MNETGNLFEQPAPFTGKSLAITGMNLAAESAENKKPGWADGAFELFKEFLFLRGEIPFRAEEFRRYAEARDCTAPEGTSKRVFAMIIVKAKKQGMIKHIGYDQTHDPKSHSANCSLWIKI